jgi:hypothetical protein
MNLFLRPAFLGCVFLFFLHQLLQKILHIHIPLLDNYSDCLLCPPILLTGLLAERRSLWGKGPGFTFSFLEVLVMTTALAVISEVIFPLLSPKFVADPWDGVAFLAGGIYFHLFLNVREM